MKKMVLMRLDNNICTYFQFTCFQHVFLNKVFVNICEFEERHGWTNCMSESNQESPFHK